MVPPDGFELSTSPLPMVCSTPELRRLCLLKAGANCHRPLLMARHILQNKLQTGPLPTRQVAE